MALNIRLRSLLTVCISLLFPIVPFVLIGEMPGERWLTAAGSDSVLFGAAGAALLGVDVFLPVPSSIVGNLLGARLGFLPGCLWAWAGLTLGNVTGYLAGRLLALRLPAELPAEPTLVLLFASRPVPILAEALTIAAGAARAPLAPFLVATLSGNAVYAAALAGSGAMLLPGAAASPRLALPMLVPAAAWLAWRLLERRRKHRRGPLPAETEPCST